MILVEMVKLTIRSSIVALAYNYLYPIKTFVYTTKHTPQLLLLLELLQELSA